MKTLALKNRRNQLIIFAVIFALIGGIIIWRSHAAPAPNSCAQYRGGDTPCDPATFGRKNLLCVTKHHHRVCKIQPQTQ